MYSNAQVDSMSNKAARRLIEAVERLAEATGDEPTLLDARRALAQPLGHAAHLAKTGREMVDKAETLDEAGLERLGVCVPDWGLAPDEIREAGEYRLTEAPRERRRALAMVGLASYP